MLVLCFAMTHCSHGSVEDFSNGVGQREADASTKSLDVVQVDVFDEDAVHSVGWQQAGKLQLERGRRVKDYTNFCSAPVPMVS